ncbi:MAG: polysaccharide pyruvyl transferase CsaB [Faecousia sp.]
MRIIHIISGGDVGGAKTHVLSLLKGLGERHEILLVCFMEGPFAQDARRLGIPTQVMADCSFLAARKRILGLIQERKMDLVHCHGSRANLMGWMLKRDLDVPLITTVHSDPKLDYLGRPLSNLTYGTANRLALRRMDDWVCVSEELRDTLLGKGMDPLHTFTIVNGVDFTNPPRVTPREEFWKALNFQLDRDSVVFGIAARVSPVKDIGTLIRAFAKAVAQEPGIRLAIAGDGEQRQEMEELAERICPPGTVLFAGWLQDTASFFAALDVNTITSLSEGLPYAIPEGARMRCPTIATRVGAIPRIVVDGETGFLVEPGDVDALADRMLRLARDAHLRHEMGEAIYRLAGRNYSVEAMVRAQEEIYETILRRRRRPANEKDGVLICGAYGNGNVGDETILEAILQQMRRHDPDMPICVMSKRPRQTCRHNQVSSVYTFDFLKTRREMKKARLFISGGGSLIQDATSTRSLLFYLHAIRSARRYGCKVMMYGCGIGPVSRKANRRRAARIIDDNVDLISLRDPDSQRELESLGVSRPLIRVTADPALLQAIPDEKEQAYRDLCKQAGLKPEGRYCLFALRPWGSVGRKLQVFAHAAAYAYERYGLTPVFFQLEPGKDREITLATAELVRCPKVVLPTISDGAVICALMRDMKLVISMRLHALIFAAGQGTPVVGISYDPKVSGFMDYLGQENYISSEEITDGSLCDLIDGAMGCTLERGQLLDRLQELAGRNDELAWKLIRGEPIE